MNLFSNKPGSSSVPHWCTGTNTLWPGVAVGLGNIPYIDVMDMYIMIHIFKRLTNLTSLILFQTVSCATIFSREMTHISR
jgi:hypothetical protein